MPHSPAEIDQIEAQETSRFDKAWGVIDNQHTREGVADIRHKVVEEGWFGREVTDDTPNMYQSGQSLEQDAPAIEGQQIEATDIGEATIEEPEIGEPETDSSIHANEKTMEVGEPGMDEPEQDGDELSL